MKNVLLTSILSIILFSCAKNIVVTENEYIRSQAFKSQEFKELKFAYLNYMDYGKKNNTFSAIARYKNRPNIKDTIFHYKAMRDSLLVVLKSKSNIFYSKYPSNLLNMDMDDFKEQIVEN
tara:strand:+ start:563 stop:922 length:360 start_codon:yes stop_codon:yes gene_type:complete